MKDSEWLAWFQQGQKTSFQDARPLVIGILNVTPDSFFDGGRYLNLDKAYDRAMAMIAEGVDGIDIGGESSRPGAKPLSTEQELERVIPIIERIRRESDVCLSIDTYKAPVMHAALSAGVNWVNDIMALQSEGALAVMAAWKNVPVCLMHMQGVPATMQNNPTYLQGVTATINDFFAERIQACQSAQIESKRLILDPGFGFGKTKSHHRELLKQLPLLQKHGLPILLGISQKKSLQALAPLSNLLMGGLTLAVYAVLSGVRLIRTHNVRDTVEAMQWIDVIIRSERNYDAT